MTQAHIINGEITVGSYANVITGSQAIIEQIDMTKAIFTFSDAYTVRVSGVRFLGGSVQISMSNANIDTSIFQIDHCEFQLAKKYAISTTPTPPANHLSTLLTIDNCKFINPLSVLENYCDYAGVNNCWVTVSQPTTPPNTAIFLNKSGVLHFYNMLGVPGFQTLSGCRWIDNYGSVFVDHSRFGGEDAGIPTVYNYAGYDPNFPDPTQSIYGIVIRNSAVFTGHDGDPNTSVLNLQTNLPQMFIYEANIGPYANPLIVNGGNIDLDKLIQNMLPPVFPSVHQFRYVVEPSYHWDDSTIIDLIPEPLRPLINFLENKKMIASPPTVGVWSAGQYLKNKVPQLFGPTGFVVCQPPGSTTQWIEYGKSSPFPIGPRQAQTVLGGNIAKYTFNLPPTVHGFVCIITFSVNPNYLGSASYRTVGSYTISLTTGYNGTQVVDVLSNAPLFQPATVGLTPTTSLHDLYFGTGNSGSNERPTTSGGSFIVLWTEASRIEEAYISIEILHLF